MAGRTTLAMIVKNEAENLGRCLDSVAHLMDEMVVVDTGSSDGTKELAAASGAKVFDFAWVDDFAAARNESIRQATGEWIFWLDGDEWLDATNQFRLKELIVGLSDQNFGYVMNQRSPTQFLWGGEPAYTGDQIARQVRLFRRDPRIRWESRVFEQIRPSIRRTGGIIEQTGIVIEHSGYVTADNMRKRLERNLRLLEMQNAEHPDDPYTLFGLADLLTASARGSQAVVFLDRCLAVSPPDSQVWLRAQELRARIR